MDRELLTVKQVSVILNMPLSRVRYLCFRNEIPYIKIGRSVRFDLSELRNWIRHLKKGVSND